jgi:hypothetical protein
MLEKQDNERKGYEETMIPRRMIMILQYFRLKVSNCLSGNRMFSDEHWVSAAAAAGD